MGSWAANTKERHSRFLLPWVGLLGRASLPLLSSSSCSSFFFFSLTGFSFVSWLFFLNGEEDSLWEGGAKCKPLLGGNNARPRYRRRGLLGDGGRGRNQTPHQHISHCCSSQCTSQREKGRGGTHTLCPIFLKLQSCSRKLLFERIPLFLSFPFFFRFRARREFPFTPCSLSS